MTVRTPGVQEAPAAATALDARAALAHGAGMLGIVLVLLSPVYLTSRGFGPDWTVHLWALWVQGAHISDGTGPRLFLDGGFLGAFFPYYAFYGGTLYTIGGGLSALLGGHPIVAYAGMWTLAFSMAYGGLLWLSLQAGLRGWRAHAASFMFVTSAYYLTNAYARGTWPELTATSALMLVVAAGVHLLRADRIRVLPAAVFLGAVLLFTGSHNITLVWGTVTVALLAVVALVALPHHGRELGLRRLAAVAGLGLLAVAVNAWFLLPDLAYANRTLITTGGLYRGVSDWFDAPANIFNPLRETPAQSTTPSLYVQLPVLVLAWTIAIGVLALRQPVSRAWRRLMAGVAVVGGLLLLLLLASWPWDALPTFLTYLQFTFRLESYILLCLALLVIAGLVWLGRGAAPRSGRGLTGALAVALVFGGGIAVWQTWSTPSLWMQDRRQTFTGPTELPKTWYDPGFFRDQSQPIVPGAPDQPQVIVPFDAAAKDRTVVVAAPPGVQTVTTNLATGPYLLDVQGAEPVGRTVSGWLVLRRPADQVDAPTMKLRLSVAESTPVVAGHWITRLALIGVALVLLGLALLPRLPGRRTLRPFDYSCGSDDVGA